MAMEGVVWGTVTALKFLIALFSSNWIIMTTKPKEILLALNRLGVPIKITFVAMTALRFVPIIMEEWYITLNAQQARGLRINKLNIRGLLSMLTTTLSTLIVNSIRRARILALAMETRAFGADVTKVTYHKLKMTRSDKVLAIVILVATVLIMVLTLFYPYHTGYTL